MNLFNKVHDRKKSKVRNKTLPEQRSAVYSYYRAKSKSNSNGGTKKDQTKKIFGTNLFKRAIAVMIIPIVVYFTTLTSTPDINFNEQHDLIRPQEEYNQSVMEFIDSSFLNRSKLTADVGGLGDHLASRFPEVKTVDVSMPVFSRNLKVELDLYEPIFLVDSQGTSVVVSQNGTVLTDNYIGTDKLIQVTDTSGVTPEGGKPVFPAQTGTFIASFAEQLDSRGITVQNVEISSNPFDIGIGLEGRAYKVKANVLEDPAEQSGALLAFISEYKSKGLDEPKEYIDVRVSERIFFR